MIIFYLYNYILQRKTLDPGPSAMWNKILLVPKIHFLQNQMQAISLTYDFSILRKQGNKIIPCIISVVS